MRRENSDPEDGHSNGNSPEDAEAILGLLTPLLHPTVAERISRGGRRQGAHTLCLDGGTRTALVFAFDFALSSYK